MPRRKKRTTTRYRTTTTRRRKTTRTPRRRVKIHLKQQTVKELCAISFFGLAIILYLSLIGQAGPIGEVFELHLTNLFGKGVFLFPVALTIAAFVCWLSKSIKFHITKILGIFIGLASFLGMLHLRSPYMTQLESVEQYGGYVGFVSSFLLRHFFDEFAAGIILSIVFLGSIIVTFDLSLGKILSLFHPSRLPLPSISIAKTQEEDQDEKAKKPAQKFEVVKIVKPKLMKSKKKKSEEVNEESDNEEVETPKSTMETVEEQTNINFPVSDEEDQEEEEKVISDGEKYKDWKLPDLDLLDDERSEMEIDEEILREKAVLIKEKLNQFGIDVTMRDINVGPTVTQFTLEPREGIKLTKITTLKNDLALALASKSIRIEAPIPGKSLIGIETPNDKRMVVHLRELVESKEFKATDSNLRLVLGRDVSGKPVVDDLHAMPHLLIAGRTGSGKSVCMNAFLLSLLYQNSPSDLKFIMIDPKMVELGFYNGIAHLLTPVITDADKAVSALRWATSEMSRRYRLFNEKRYRNITEYNENEKEKLCKIVIVVDELADLMMRGSKKETEGLICRIAQMARAVGMHLIVATQRPSVDVITGLIKANIPTRIAFAVSSGVDSRTILDGYGAEDLLGRGDMLYLPGGMGSVIRIQGVWVSRKEIERVTNRIKLTVEPDYDESIIEERVSLSAGGRASGVGGFGDFDDSDDERFEEAIEVVKKTGKASATLLQRYMGIGYARAAKLLDMMEERGLIGPSCGAKAREIFMFEEEVKEEGMGMIDK